MDNLYAHKTSMIWDIMKKNIKASILYTPSATPQFSPIENLFAHTKKILMDEIITNKQSMASKISEVMFQCD